MRGKLYQYIRAAPILRRVGLMSTVNPQSEGYVGYVEEGISNDEYAMLNYITQ